LAAACAKAPDAALFANKPQAPMPTAPAPTTVTMDVPENWQSIEIDQPFYLAKWDLPNGGRATISYLGSNVESVAMNIDRWMGQWSVQGSSPEDARVFEGKIIGEQEVYQMTLEGTLNSTAQVGGGDPRADWMLVGAIMLKDFGPVYLKVVGPGDDLRDQADVLFSNFSTATF
jgi:hypothetical protein